MGWQRLPRPRAAQVSAAQATIEAFPHFYAHPWPKRKKKKTLQYYREDHNAKMDFILLLSSSTVSLLIFIYTKSLIVLSDPLLASSVCHGHVKQNIISDAAFRTQVFS